MKFRRVNRSFFAFDERDAGREKARDEANPRKQSFAAHPSRRAEMNNNLTTERAVLGVFAPTSYISFGDKVRDDGGAHGEKRRETRT